MYGIFATATRKRQESTALAHFRPLEPLTFRLIPATLPLRFKEAVLMTDSIYPPGTRMVVAIVEVCIPETIVPGSVEEDDYVAATLSGTMSIDKAWYIINDVIDGKEYFKPD